MYVIGKGQDINGPGTSMVQRIAWDRASETQLNKAAGLGGCRGMGCGGMKGCGCAGLGLFDAGMDFTTWGWPEWGIVGVGVYAAMSLLGDTKRGVDRTRRVGKAVRKAV